MIWVICGGIPFALFLSLVLWCWVQQFGVIMAMIMVIVVVALTGAGFALSYGIAQLAVNA